MKVRKLVSNPIHAGGLFIDADEIVLDEETVSASDLAALKEYAALGEVALGPDKEPVVARHKIQEADGVVEEDKVQVEEPAKRPTRKTKSANGK